MGSCCQKKKELDTTQALPSKRLNINQLHFVGLRKGHMLTCLTNYMTDNCQKGFFFIVTALQ